MARRHRHHPVGHAITWEEGQDLASQTDRAAFITRTYLHVFGAIIAFILAEIAIFQTSIPEQMFGAMSKAWWLFLLAFMGVGWFASRVAHQSLSIGAQYAALAAYVAVEVVIFVPLIYMATKVAPEGTIASAATITMVGFGLLSVIVHATRKDFSFLRGIIIWGGIMALVTIFGAMIFGFHLGVLFSGIMIALAGAMILYETSNIIHHYPTDRHVGAALGLFASVALLFWYVLRIMIQLGAVAED